MMRDMKKRSIRVIAIALCMGFLLWESTRKPMEIVKDIFIDESTEEVPLDDTPMDGYYTILSEVLLLVPQKIVDQFYADGWNIVITNESLSDKYYKGVYSNVMAVTDGKIKIIWLSNTEKSIREATIHEIGHYIEFTRGYPNRSAEFQAIYEAEKNQFVLVNGSAAQAKGSSLEYFAEAFQETILHPDSMMQNTPQTYQYMVNMINNF